MTTTTAPHFRVHAALPAFLRLAWVALLCAALTAGFLHEVQRGSSQAADGLDEMACATSQGQAC
jgi:hypothetical protein